jgi:hypothetical protein
MSKPIPSLGNAPVDDGRRLDLDEAGELLSYVDGRQHALSIAGSDRELDKIFLERGP